MFELSQEWIDYKNHQIAIFLGLKSTGNHRTINDIKDVELSFPEYINDILGTTPFYRSEIKYKLHFHSDWNHLMYAYTELCRRITYKFCSIKNDKVFDYREIEINRGGFQRELFCIVGDCCEKYNNKEIFTPQLQYSDEQVG